MLRNDQNKKVRYRKGEFHLEVIKLRLSTSIIIKLNFPIAMALGYFDGVHLGHQQVILEAKKHAEEKGFTVRS